MLQQLDFVEDTLQFRGLNIIIGENGTGKSYILKQIAQQLNAHENMFRHDLDTSAVTNLPLEIARLMDLPQKVVLWDMPEIGLNPKKQKVLPETMVGLLNCGIQVFVTTHSNFLLRELEVVLWENKVTAQWIGVHFDDDGKVVVKQSKYVDDTIG